MYSLLGKLIGFAGIFGFVGDVILGKSAVALAEPSTPLLNCFE